MKGRVCMWLLATLAALCTPAALATAAPEKILRMVVHADLKVLDPTFTTAYISRNMGYMVYDTLFSQTRKGEVQPQMVERYSVSPNGLVWQFVLRPGLKFSDGTPVTSKDVLASIARWAVRDNMGQLMQEAGAQWSSQGERNFSLRLQRPFGLVLEALSRPSSYPLFILPERLARKPTDAPLTEVLGSGPFAFKRDEWAPSHKAVFVRNVHYAPRTEVPDGLAGNKSPRFDRVEWLYQPDAAHAVAALKRGEVDYIEQVAPDYITPLRSGDDIKIVAGGAYQGFFIFNHLHPPFNNPKVRQAVQKALDQNKVMAALGFPADMRLPSCLSFFVCGSPNATEAGAEGFRTPSIEAAKQLLQQAGYQGEPVVVLMPTDVVYLMAGSLMGVQTMRSMGMNVSIQNSDWATITQRRTKRDAPADGGWNMYFTVGSEFDANSPITSMLGPPCGADEPGWACDAKLDQLRKRWVQARAGAERKAALEAFHTRVYEVVPYAMGGQYSTASAVRKSLKGVEHLWAGIPNVWVLDR